MSLNAMLRGVLADARSNLPRGPEPTPAPPDPVSEFDPAGHTISEVKAYLALHPMDRQAVRDAEAARGDEARSSLLRWLDDPVTG